MSQKSTTEAELAIMLGVCGVIWGFAVGILSLLMAGAGHGWGEGLYSAITIVLAPFAGAGWAFRRRRAGPFFAVLALLPAVYVDWLLCTHTSYVDRVLTYMPGVFALWLGLWLAWQALALGVLGSAITKIGKA